MRGATSRGLPPSSPGQSFNSRTPCGVRPGVSCRRLRGRNSFNSRTPCGVRHHGADNPSDFVQVSIHAPRAGCDLAETAEKPVSPSFQFTHPVRGATFVNLRHVEDVAVSIHAPRAGCDIFCFALSCINNVVSIHAPRAGCDRDLHLPNARGQVSIHAPRAGCDLIFSFPDSGYNVSIHAPRAGCDSRNSRRR